MTLGNFLRRHYLCDGDRIVVKGYIPERDEFITLITISRNSTINVLSEIPEWDLALVATVHHENEDEAAEDNLEYVMVTTEITTE